MKTITLLAFAAAMLATPALAKITDVDHPNIPNCVMFPKSGHNAPNCETLSIQAVHPNNGLGTKYNYTFPGPDNVFGTPDDEHSSGYSW